MARRISLKGICNDLLSAFGSRNNDLDGYWSLGQCSAWLKDEDSRQINISLTGKPPIHKNPQVAAISRHFTAVLVNMLSSNGLNTEWVKDGHILIERLSDFQIQCSVSLVSDLDRQFHTTKSFAVRSHNPRRELRRELDKWGIRTKPQRKAPTL